MTLQYVRWTRRSAAIATLALTGYAASGVFATAAAQSPDAIKLATKAANALMKSRSVTFTLSAKYIVPGFGLAAVTVGEGTLLLPDQMVFQGKLQSTPAMQTAFVVASCGGTQYVEMGDGNFMKMDAIPNIGKVLFSSDSSFVAGLLKGIKDVSAPKAVKLNDTDSWHITGTVPPEVLQTLPSRKNPNPGPVKAEIWISKKDSRIQQLTLLGPLLDTDVAETSRVLTFPKFDDKDALTVPRGKFPCSASSTDSAKTAK